MKHTEMAALGDYTDALSLFLDPVPSKQSAVQTLLSPQWRHLAYKAGSDAFIHLFSKRRATSDAQP